MFIESATINQPILTPFRIVYPKTNFMHYEKIKTIRELRGFSQEYLADKLGIAQNTYSKIESGQTKLTADMLKNVAEILGVKPEDILSNQPAIINFEQNPITQSVFVENLYAYQREVVEKLIASKDNEIQNLKDIISNLIKSDKANNWGL